MQTITLLVGDIDAQGRLPVQFVPNDGLDAAMQLSALRMAENILIAQLVREAEERGRAEGTEMHTMEEENGNDPSSGQPGHD